MLMFFEKQNVYISPIRGTRLAPGHNGPPKKKNLLDRHFRIETSEARSGSQLLNFTPITSEDRMRTRDFLPRNFALSYIVPRVSSSRSPFNPSSTCLFSSTKTMPIFVIKCLLQYTSVNFYRYTYTRIFSANQIIIQII